MEVVSVNGIYISVVGKEDIMQTLHISQLEPVEDAKEVDLEYLVEVYHSVKDNYNKVVGAYPVKLDKESFLSGIMTFLLVIGKLQQK